MTPFHARSASTDPLATFMARLEVGQAPSPQTEVSIEITVEAGLAEATVIRRFRNDEDRAIEACLTFPVPVHAALYDLTARIGERRLRATAQANTAARETYEAAVERGKAAVLHEELLKGVHMLSVGQIPPGAEVEVTCVWAMTLSAREEGAELRIPLTVGDVYGASGLMESDEMIHGGPAPLGRLRVRSHDGPALLRGRETPDDWIEIPLDRPLDLRFPRWTPRALRGAAADGSVVELTVTPREPQDLPLDLLLLVDHSASMSARCAPDGADLTKHQAAIEGLGRLADRLTAADAMVLCEFHHKARLIGVVEPETAEETAPADALRGLIAQLSDPSGGTEIGGALRWAMTHTTTRDALLITDGKSHAMDVQALARDGRRISVLLVGEDSLEANVGHLAALTGGEIFVASAEDIAEALLTAIESLRSEAPPRPRIKNEPESLERALAGMSVAARWRRDRKPAEGPMARATAALAASLALPAMAEDAAMALAVAEGLVTHLTSLVLVDEAGESQQGQPDSRKIALPTPALWVASLSTLDGDFNATAHRMAMKLRSKKAHHPLGGVARFPDESVMQKIGVYVPLDRREPAPDKPRSERIDWSRRPEHLAANEVSDLPPDVAASVAQIAADPVVISQARRLGVTPELLALTLYARDRAARDAGAEDFVARVLRSHGIAKTDLELAFAMVTI